VKKRGTVCITVYVPPDVEVVVEKHPFIRAGQVLLHGAPDIGEVLVLSPHSPPLWFPEGV
jgi:hypothetical protein